MGTRPLLKLEILALLLLLVLVVLPVAVGGRVMVVVVTGGVRVLLVMPVREGDWDPMPPLAFSIIT